MAFIFKENLSDSIGIDECAIFSGDFYTIILNKKAGNKKGSIIAMIEGTKSSKIINALDKKINIFDKIAIKDVTIDLGSAVEWIARDIGVNAEIIYDRFHVEKLVFDALQNLRIHYRRIELEKDEENEKRLLNGDTKKQLLIRSRYLLYKPSYLWTKEQKLRAEILFKEYPIIQKAYNLVMELKTLYNKRKFGVPPTFFLEEIANKMVKSKIGELVRVGRTLIKHLTGIANYFNQRKTNALLENFNSKIKTLLRNIRGTNDRVFFLYRLFKLYA